MKVLKVVRKWYLQQFLRIPKFSNLARKALSKEVLDRDTYVIGNIGSTMCFICWYTFAYLCLIFEKIAIILHIFFALLSFASLVLLIFFFFVLTQRFQKHIRYNMDFPMHWRSILISLLALASVGWFTWRFYPDSIGVNAWKWFPALPIVLKSCFFVSHVIAMLMIRDAYLAYSATYLIIYTRGTPTTCVVSIDGVWKEFNDPRWGFVLEENERRLANRTRNGMQLLTNSSTPSTQMTGST